MQTDACPNTGRLRGEVNRKVKLLTEAPVNGGPNYEVHKVAKFLVGYVPTRINSLITWPLSPSVTRLNRNGGEDAAYPPQDEKTP
jgi:hypothetical protein